MHTHMCAKLEEMHIEKNGMLKAHRFQVGVLKTRILKMRALSDADDNISGKHEEEAKSEKTEAEDRIAFLEGQLATASAARETTTFARRESNEMCLKLQNKIDELTQFMGEMSSQYMSLIVQQEVNHRSYSRIAHTAVGCHDVSQKRRVSIYTSTTL